MATNNQRATRSSRQPADAFERAMVGIGVELEGHADATVERTYEPFIEGSEPFEHLRDALKRETKLRLTPPDPWRAEKQTTCERSWTARGHVVRLSKPTGVRGVLGSWSVSVDVPDAAVGETTVLEDVSRLEAFEAAAAWMEDIADLGSVEV